MQLQSRHSSPLVFIIPFAVMFIAIAGVLVFMNQSQDIRGRAGNSTQEKCVTACTRFGGQGPACKEVCTNVASGQMTCAEAAAAAVPTNNQQLFINTCESFGDKNPLESNAGSGAGSQYCKNKCEVDYQNTSGTRQRNYRGMCNAVCNAVVYRGQTCAEACDVYKTDRGGCMNMCATFRVPTTTP